MQCLLVKGTRSPLYLPKRLILRAESVTTDRDRLECMVAHASSGCEIRVFQRQCRRISSVLLSLPFLVIA
ncbi:MAG: hypothetical protein CBE43_03930 [Rhodopirellula sp. TMED283]|nr:MAG: hypothetical protein CBE43_03930 [Rhodopirellula sp. TMED283]